MSKNSVKQFHKLVIALIVAWLCSSAQASEINFPQDQEVISQIRREKRINFKEIFKSDWEAICLSGEYQHPVSDIKYELGKNFNSCFGSYSELRDDGLQAISIIWKDKCRVIDINTDDFFIERQNGTQCYNRKSIKDFIIKPSPYGQMLMPED